MQNEKHGAGFFRYFTDLIQDFRFAIRSHSRRPALGLAVILVLSIGIGATTAVFSIVNSVLLRPFAIKDHDRLVMIWETNPSKGNYEVEVSYPNFVSWRQRSQAFDQMVTLPSVNLDLTLTGGKEPEQVQATSTTANFFSMLGVNAAMGRTLQMSDDEPTAEPVVVISNGLWKRRFGGDANVIGKTVTVDGQVATVVGVMPASFDFPRGIELWGPLTPESSSWTKDRSFRVLMAIGHLKPGIKLADAQAEMDRVASLMGKDFPEEDAGYGIRLIPLDTVVLGNARAGLWILFGAVLMVLLIACINVANLLLARAIARRKEVIIRLALGAGRMRLIRQMVAEGLLLSIISGFLGLLLSQAGLKYLISIAPADIPRIEGATIDGKVIAFTVVLSFLTVFIFGLAPAIQATKYDLNQSLKGVDGKSSRQGSRLRVFFVVSEIALAMILLVAAGLLVRSFVKLQRIDPGFKADNILSMRIPLSQSRYTTSNDRKLFFSRLLEKIESLSGVESAGLVLMRPLSGTIGWDYPFTVEGQTPDQQQANPYSNYEEISPGYFRTMGINLIRGREFTVDDRGNDRTVAIVGESMAKRFWPNEDPIGKRLKFGEANSKSSWLTVVGVVRDVNYREWTASKPDIYVSYLQRAQYRADFVIRTKVNPLTMVNSIKKEVYSLDKDQAVTSVTTMSELVDASLARAKFNGFLLSIFSAVAACLAAMGIYSVVAYSVSQRTKEMGIRMALGARIADIVTAIIYQEMRPIAIGVGLGLVGAFIVTRTMTGLLYGVGKYDPVTFVSVVALLTSTAVAACLIPALRAGKTDPMVVLRDE